MRKQSGQAIALYVALTGNDTWSGRLAAPDVRGCDGPFRTVERARKAVRALNNSRSRRPIRVSISGGLHLLSRTLEFEPRDSGTADCPVTYAAYPGEQPTLSGGRLITGWRTGMVNGKACWMVDLPEVARGDWNFSQLFVNGSRRLRPRLPREGFYRFTGMAEGTAPFTGWHTGPDRALFAPGDIKVWKNLDDVDLTSYVIWFSTHHRIKSVDEAAGTVYFKANGIGALKDERNQWARYCVENVFEALDTPGQWYLDRPAGCLYYLPLPGEDHATAEVIAPALATLVHLQGTLKNPVAHIRFENLAFQHAEWRLPPDNTGAVQAAFSVPGAIILHCAEDCALYGCSVSKISQYGVEVCRGSARNRIIACSIFDMGAGGIKICHEGMERTDPTSPVPVPAIDKPMRTTVTDCRIHDGGQVHAGAVGIWIGNSGRNRVSHNEIYNLFYTGISCGWIWGYGPTLAVGNRIEFNHIYNIGQGLLSDIGGIYLLGPQPGTVVRNNIVHDLFHYGYAGLGIYTDEGSSQILIENNITYRIGNNGFFQHYGRHNLIRNNIFAFANEAAIGRGGEEHERSFVVERNILLADRGGWYGGAWGDGHFLLARNLYWSAHMTSRPFFGFTLAERQARGQDIGSIIADPLFADPAAGDFTLRADTPARAIGFKPINISRVGPRQGVTRANRIDELPVDRVPPARIIQTRLEFVNPPEAIPAATPYKVRLIIHNHSEIPVADSIALRIRPDAAGTIPAGRRVAYRLKPGGEMAATFQVIPAANAGFFSVETVGRGPEFVPTCLFICHHRRWPVRRLDQPVDVARLGDLLAGDVPHQARLGAMHLAEIRMADAGDDVALSATVEDRLCIRGHKPWAGSCVEIFGSMPGTTRIGQVFLLPATMDGTGSATAFRQVGSESVAAPEIRVHAVSTASGYRIDALIPRALLAVDQNAGFFLVECAVQAAPDAARGLVRTTLFGGANAYATSSGYGMAITGS